MIDNEWMHFVNRIYRPDETYSQTRSVNISIIIDESWRERFACHTKYRWNEIAKIHSLIYRLSCWSRHSDIALSKQQFLRAFIRAFITMKSFSPPDIYERGGEENSSPKFLRASETTVSKVSIKSVPLAYEAHRLPSRDIRFSSAENGPFFSFVRRLSKSNRERERMRERERESRLDSNSFSSPAGYSERATAEPWNDRN